MDALSLVQDLFRRSIETKQKALESVSSDVVTMAKICADCLDQGGKIMFCGNGGSAADAQHLAAELLVRLRSEVNRRGLPALALALDSSSMTACSNDYSYMGFYERMTQTLGQKGDVLIGITTSGRSENINLALQAGRSMGITTLGFLGGDGGAALPLCDHALVVPSNETGRIQEVHITAGHALIEIIENTLLERGSITHLS